MNTEKINTEKKIDDESLDTNSVSSISSNIDDEIYWTDYSNTINEKEKILLSILHLIKDDILIDINIVTRRTTINLNNNLFSQNIKIMRTNKFMENMCSSNELNNVAKKINLNINDNIGNIFKDGEQMTIDKYTFVKDFKNCRLVYHSEKVGIIEYQYSVHDENKINAYDMSNFINIGTFEIV